MKLELNNWEVDVLREALSADIDGLLMEIARADVRKAKEDLRMKEGLLKGIMDKLAPVGVEGKAPRGAAA